MNEQETIEDIIAEMLGARTEFPFVYLMGERDTPEVIDLRTKEIIAPRKLNIRRVTVKELAGRLETARKRESGDRAKLRDALVKARKVIKAMGEYWARETLPIIDAALDAPPRNCDMPLVVDGPAYNNADKAWHVFKRHNPDAYFDVSGLLRCIDWLLAPSTERKGESDE